ncbi:MAG: hypothetical protein M1834_006700 [Cirrosporium novae-zelandiae]|nr:MAG: hypothetical protein M1834_006700 [Cirrosporium novae-zelandiae]
MVRRLLNTTLYVHKLIVKKSSTKVKSSTGTQRSSGTIHEALHDYNSNAQRARLKEDETNNILESDQHMAFRVRSGLNLQTNQNNTPPGDVEMASLLASPAICSLTGNEERLEIPKWMGFSVAGDESSERQV